MKTLEELVKELGLIPSWTEITVGRLGNYVHIFDDNTYITFDTLDFPRPSKKVIEVKPE